MKTKGRDPHDAGRKRDARTRHSGSALRPGVSVIICCHNSVGRIEPTLRHLAAQVVRADTLVEVIVVDNASTDDLADAVRSHWDGVGAPFPLRVVPEPQPGLSFARKAGVLAAQYAYGVFCDDDNWLAPNYLQCVVDLLDGKPEIGAVGGSSVPAFEMPAPPWFFNHSGSYAVGAQALQSGDVTYRCFLWGAGLGFRLSFLREVYASGRDPLVVDRQGGNLTSGGDGEICCWFIFAGYRLWYDDRLMFTHFIPSGRLTDEYIARMREGFGSSGFRTYRSYVIWKYGLLGDPRGHHYAGLMRVVKKARALMTMAASGIDLRRVREFERLCRTID